MYAVWSPNYICSEFSVTKDLGTPSLDPADVTSVVNISTWEGQCEVFPLQISTEKNLATNTITYNDSCLIFGEVNLLHFDSGRIF